MFSQPSFNTIGDEYDKKLNVPDRVRGPQFKTSPSKKGHTVDTYFDKKFKSLSEGDKFIDPGTLEKKEKLEASKKKVTTDGFRYTSPGKRSAGLGNNFGCFDAFKHETEYVVVRKGEVPSKAQAAPRNMVTSPPRKGTYGFMGTTLGKGDEFKYISDPYDGERRKEIQDAKSGQKKFIGAGPFKASCKRGDYFDGQPNVPASRIYTLDRPLPARKPEAPHKDPAVAVPFRPSNPPRRGFNSTIGRLPEYKEDPYEQREKREHEERQKNRPSVMWKPVSGSKTLPTRSIAFNAAAS
jgi:hypothetical protein